ncbi:transmembrane protein, putative (macronuclear) [Tetrahymena thermophila SB210]|uniref:Transmembrane protein, putative n=1 Tax=Tetrahymena thermophila (strain SB210) TaxID=312017 RepID=W7XDA8_TETTS|nr:transmembrane protein, putative [Tetrahymena thermophila SB210]EWS75507.1 transmembrane protein, putative [Tetrahymena thermophila SB210]|eukprot:XP_012651976.1 transmembrane protein, putative [Tetrahymena thermophila SB210]
MGFEIKEELDLFQICIDSIDQDKIKQFITSLQKNILNKNKLQQIILSIDYKLLDFFKEIIDNLKKVTLSKNKELVLQIFLYDIEDLFKNNIRNLQVDFAINIYHKIKQQNLIQILYNEGYPSKCANIIAKILFDENQDQNLETNYHFQITQIQDKYIFITQSEISLNSLQISILKETVIKYLKYKKKYAIQHQVSQSQINKNKSYILQNILQNKNQRKQFEIFLISFQQKIEYDANLNYTCDFFQKIYLIYVKNNIKIRNNAYLNLYQESYKKFNSDYEQELISKYVSSKLSSKYIKNLNLDFSQFNFELDGMTIESLKFKLQKHQLFSLKIQFTDSLFEYKTLTNFLKCIKLYKFGKICLNFYNIEFKSIERMKDILDYLYQNKILFQINIQESKLIDQKDINQLIIQYSNKDSISLQFLKEVDFFIHLIIDQSSNNNLKIKSLNGIDPESWNNIKIQQKNVQDIEQGAFKCFIFVSIGFIGISFFLNSTHFFLESLSLTDEDFATIVFLKNIFQLIIQACQQLLSSSLMIPNSFLIVIIFYLILLIETPIFLEFCSEMNIALLNFQHCSIIQSLASFLFIYYNKQLCILKINKNIIINKYNKNYF